VGVRKAKLQSLKVPVSYLSGFARCGFMISLHALYLYKNQITFKSQQI